MHGFPLQFKRVKKRMHYRKRKFSTEQEAWQFTTDKHNTDVKSVYLCPFCMMYHVSTHEHDPKYEQERWNIIWHLEGLNGDSHIHAHS